MYADSIYWELAFLEYTQRRDYVPFMYQKMWLYFDHVSVWIRPEKMCFC